MVTVSYEIAFDLSRVYIALLLVLQYEAVSQINTAAFIYSNVNITQLLTLV